MKSLDRRRVVFIVLAVVLPVGGWLVGPNWLAGQLPHATGLRGAIVTVGDLTVYAPWSVGHWLPWRPGHEAAFAWAWALTSSGPVWFGLIVMVDGLIRAPRVKPIGLLKWAHPRTFRRLGLRAGRGTIVGQVGRRRRRELLTYDGPEHQLVVGASRSGKGVGHVIPTLLAWPDSTMVYDPKGELWEATSGWRSRHGYAVRFNPCDPSSARYNPLLDVRRGPHEIRDAQNVAEILVDQGNGRRDEPWDSEAAQLLTAVILHVLYAEPPERKTIGRVRELILDVDESLPIMMQTLHRQGAGGESEPHPEVARVAKHLATQAPKFRDSVRGTATSRLVLWADETVQHTTASSDFDAGDLVCLEHPTNLYLQPPPSDAARVRPLMRLMLNQLTRALLEHIDADQAGRPKRRPLLLLIDEFPTLKKMEFLSQNMRQMAGYGIKAYLVVQSFQDIEEYYGPSQTIIDNCHLIAAFATADVKTQQRISQMTGTTTEYRASYSRSVNGLGLGRRTVSYSEQVRPLLQPGEVRALPSDEQLIFLTGHPPLRTHKVRYFDDPLLARRVLPAAEKPCDLPSRPGNAWEEVWAEGALLPPSADGAMGVLKSEEQIKSVGGSEPEASDAEDVSRIIEDAKSLNARIRSNDGADDRQAEDKSEASDSAQRRRRSYPA